MEEEQLERMLAWQQGKEEQEEGDAGIPREKVMVMYEMKTPDDARSGSEENAEPGWIADEMGEEEDDEVGMGVTVRCRDYPW